MHLYDGPVRAAWGASLIVAVVATGASARADDPAGHFVATASMHLARDGARAVLVDHQVLVIGGENFLEGPLRSAEAWRDGGKGGASWTEAGRMQVPRVGHTVTALPDGRVLVVGGGGRDPNARLAEVWGEDDGVHDLPMFRPAGRLSVGRRFHTATLLPDGRVLVMGGAIRRTARWRPRRSGTRSGARGARPGGCVSAAAAIRRRCSTTGACWWSAAA